MSVVLSDNHARRQAQLKLIAGVLLTLAAIVAVGIVGMVFVGAADAQSTSPTAEVPGLDAGETGNITVAIEWNSNATTSDTASVDIDYVTDESTGSLAGTDEHTIDADPTNTTESTFLVEPDQDVELFEVTTEAVAENVSSVEVTSSIEADNSTAGGGGGSLSIGGGVQPIHVLLTVLAILVVGIVLDRRRK